MSQNQNSKRSSTSDTVRSRRRKPTFIEALTVLHRRVRAAQKQQKK